MVLRWRHLKQALEVSTVRRVLVGLVVELSVVAAECWECDERSSGEAEAEIEWSRPAVSLTRRGFMPSRPKLDPEERVAVLTVPTASAKGPIALVGAWVRGC